MKVVCDNCQAKYQVPDERVAGKKLKIRCRKCASTIIVRGDQLVADAVAAEPGFQDEATVAVAHSGGEDWFASVDGAEHGPMDQTSLVGWLIEQPGAWDTYVWREGFGDWVAARYVDTLTDAAAALGFHVGDSADQDGPASQEADEEVVPTQPRPNALLEAAPVAQQAAVQAVSSRQARPESSPRYEAFAVEPAAASYAAGQDYSAAYDSAPSYASMGGAVSRRSSSPRVSAAAAMTGQRNEESVLFNAAALQRVASPSYANVAPAASSPGARGGYASGEGSGLIDIRALAAMSAATAAQQQAEVRAQVPASNALLPEDGALPRLDTLSPVAMPNNQAKPSSNAMPIALFGAAVVLAAAIVTVAFVLNTNEPTLATPAAATAPSAPPQLLAAEVPGEAAEVVAVPEEADAVEEGEEAESASESETGLASADGDEATDAQPEAAAPAKGSVKAKKARAKARAARARVASRKAAAKAAPEKEEEPLFKDETKAAEKAPVASAEPEASPSIDDLLAGPAPEPKKAAAPPKQRSIDDLLDTAVDKGSPAVVAKTAPAPAAKSDLAAQPSRDEVLQAMRSVTPAVQRCGSQNGAAGSVAKVKLSVTSSGAVTGASVTGVEGAAASCIEQAVKKAKFAEFSKPSFTVNFPFRL